MKKLLKGLLVILLTLAALACCLVLWLTVREYKPADTVPLEVYTASDAAPAGRELEILSWNIGYCGLGENADFFMDGGKSVRSDDEDVLRYLSGVHQTLEDVDPDLALLQEVDFDSHRSYGLPENVMLYQGGYACACNYVCDFVPYPLPPIGKVNGGLMTDFGACVATEAERVALPCPFSWPVRTANLKRCLLVSRLPVQDSDRELVLVNLHLEAYDDGEGKRAQTEQLRGFIQAEYEKGNYVIAGGDFNQVFPGSLERYPNRHPELWEPGVLEEALLGEGWRFAYDMEMPSCRLLNQPYDPADTENTRYYVIDGFILSPNVELQSVETLDLAFQNSDHNPVLIRVALN